MSQNEGKRKDREKMKKQFSSKIIAGDFSGLWTWQDGKLEMSKAELVPHPRCADMTTLDRYPPSRHPPAALYGGGLEALTLLKLQECRVL